MSTTDIIETMNELAELIEQLEDRTDTNRATHDLDRARTKLGQAGTVQSTGSRRQRLEDAAAIITGVAIDHGHDQIAESVNATLDRIE